MGLTPFRSSRRSRGAFTLVEIMAVVLIILILAGLILSLAGNATREADIAATRALLERVGTGLENYRAEKGAYPAPPINATTLDVEYKPNEVSGTEFVDAWGNKLQYTYNPSSSSTCRLFSMGPDGKTGNADQRRDDISN